MVSFLSHSSGETDFGKVKEKLSSGFTLASFPDLLAVQFLLQLDSGKAWERGYFYAAQL